LTRSNTPGKTVSGVYNQHVHTRFNQCRGGSRPRRLLWPHRHAAGQVRLAGVRVLEDLHILDGDQAAQLELSADDQNTLETVPLTA
jgi:hypothetical protein